MTILRTKQAVKSALQILRNSQKTIGFVPTMGALHEGHLSLVENAKLSSDSVIVSIFVNPTQFNNKEDYEKYPISIDQDLKILEEKGVDFIFLPSVEEMYTSEALLKMDFGDLDKTLEGSFRPGHFSGVGVVVSKLLNIVKPDKSYFGQKDLQQVAIIKRLVNDLSFDVEIVVVPTIRESDGLAMSSRNVRLNPEERLTSTILYKCLLFAKNELLQGGDWFEIKEKVTKRFYDEPKARLEYFELVNTDTLEKLSSIKDQKNTSICTAAYIGEVRLIDNLSIV
ncbi:pantoate--beta-alanine ligase [Belliella sp. R4-6]|uniref:Pantothenate synthetase n=1 Tax=Belliella alkalica TaxID=1730871 RepID=A0ABS9VF91_9BACT|nr:pantoate--beta-alanine ligase [Belliella alkalica]